MVNEGIQIAVERGEQRCSEAVVRDGCIVRLFVSLELAEWSLIKN